MAQSRQPYDERILDLLIGVPARTPDSLHTCTTPIAEGRTSATIPSRPDPHPNPLTASAAHNNAALAAIRLERLAAKFEPKATLSSFSGPGNSRTATFRDLVDHPQGRVSCHNPVYQTPAEPTRSRLPHGRSRLPPSQILEMLQPRNMHPAPGATGSRLFKARSNTRG